LRRASITAVMSTPGSLYCSSNLVKSVNGLGDVAMTHLLVEVGESRKTGQIVLADRGAVA
jgi:hypothetical protein